MIKNFDEVKKQLEGLSEVVNKFKSETVQLRIVELVFAGVSVPNADPVDESGGGAPSRRRPAKKRKAAVDPPGAKSESKRPRTLGNGPKATLEQFIAEGFFNQKRAIGAVVQHCKLKARNFKNNELSGPLGRLVRENKLTRTTNEEKQFEYIKK